MRDEQLHLHDSSCWDGCLSPPKLAGLDVLLPDGQLYQCLAPLTLGTCDVEGHFPFLPTSGESGDIGQGTPRELHVVGTRIGDKDLTADDRLLGPLWVLASLGL